MADIAIMVEGQMGLNWERWKRIGRAVEDLGFAGLYRSDHFTNPQGPDDDSLELWVSLTWLASHTERIEFGPMVSPFSFRNPVFTARIGYQVDDLSNGRLILGVGSGWQEREHIAFGFDLLPMNERYQRFEEGLEVVTRLLRWDSPVSYQGKYYQLHDAQLLPRPQRRTPILIGGKGKSRSLDYVVRYADEWNGVYLNLEQLNAVNRTLDEKLVAAGRTPESVKRSLMTGLVFGRDDAELQAKLEGRDIATMREHGMVVGTPTQIQDQLAEIHQAGFYRVMLQWLDLEDMDGLEAVAKALHL
jgi:F420-dependent oxidoreductase-like protein